MKPSVCIVLAALAVLPKAVGAETVFRCTENGRTIFTESATGPACRPLDIKAEPPNPEEVSRRQQELEEWNRRREDIVQQSIARETAVETQRRKAELAALGRGEARSSGDAERRSHGYRRRARAAADFP